MNKSIKAIITMLCSVFVLSATSCSQPETIGTSSNTDTVRESLELVELVPLESTSAITTVPVETPEGTITSTDTEIITENVKSLIYDNNTELRVADMFAFSLPEETCKSLVSYTELEKKVNNYISENTKADTLTKEIWHEAFDGLGYFACDKESGILMSENLILNTAVYSGVENNAEIFETFIDDTDGSDILTAYVEIMAYTLYGITDITDMQRKLNINNEDKILISYAFNAPTAMQVTDKYFGYLVIALDKATNQHSYCIIGGISGITDEAIVNNIHDSITDVDESKAYWHTFDTNS